MLDPARPKLVDLSSFEGYISSCVELAGERLAAFSDERQVAAAEDDLNLYPRLGSLSDLRDIFVVDEKSVTEKDVHRACLALMEGKMLLEHACAGEATRLGLGTKYLICPPLDLTPQVMERLLPEGEKTSTAPDELRPMTLGRRHMLQLAWDLSLLAESMGQDPTEVLSRQSLLIIVNQASADQVVDDFRAARFYGFTRAQVYFMVQESFVGIVKRDGEWICDSDSPTRLHNHGQMLMQTTMDYQLFHLAEGRRRVYLSWAKYREILGGFQDKISFNIEDLDYLGTSLDLIGLGAALKLGDQGAQMVMEVVQNDPKHPIKGGMCARDEELGRDVMIESFQLGDLPHESITFLNRNINHYPRPKKALSAVRERGLSMPLTVKNGCVYFQPVQGDVNFLVPTSFVRRRDLKPISAWKSGANTNAALQAMLAQERRPGFFAWAENLTGLDL